MPDESLKTWQHWGELDWEFGTNGYKLFYAEWIHNKALLYRTGNYIQCPVVNYNEKEDEKECVYKYS